MSTIAKLSRRTVATATVANPATPAAQSVRSTGSATTVASTTSAVTNAPDADASAALAVLLERIANVQANAEQAAATDRQIAKETRALKHLPAKVLTAMRRAENQATRHSAERYSVEFADGGVSVAVSRNGRQYATLNDGTKAVHTPAGFLAERRRKALARATKGARLADSVYTDAE